MGASIGQRRLYQGHKAQRWVTYLILGLQRAQLVQRFSFRSANACFSDLLMAPVWNAKSRKISQAVCNSARPLEASCESPAHDRGYGFLGLDYGVAVAVPRTVWLSN